MKNKTLAVYLALCLGTLGAHRLYLKGWRDAGFWLHLVAGLLGLIGLRRAFAVGQDDKLSWVLSPFFGISLCAACIAAIVYGLASQVKWNKAYNDALPAEHAAGASSGITIFGVVLALLLGSTALMSVIAFAGQRYFEYVLKLT